MMNLSRHFVSGCCGFVGFNYTLFLLKKKEVVIGFDVFLLPTRDRLKILKKYKNFSFFEIDLSSQIKNYKFFQKTNFNNYFWHFAANSDIRLSSQFSSIDYKNSFLSTKNFLEFSKKINANFFFFASSSAIYGDRKEILNEKNTKKLPVSNYGKMKLKSENIILKDTFIKNKVIFRFPNVIGKHLTHGILFDLKQKLKKSNELNVLGNGTQSKPYIRVNKLIKLIFLSKNIITKNNTEIFNIGPHNQGTSVKIIVNKLVKKYKKKINIFYEKKNIGWSGDINKVRFNTKKMYNFFNNKKINSDIEVENYFKYDFNKNSL